MFCRRIRLIPESQLSIQTGLQSYSGRSSAESKSTSTRKIRRCERRVSCREGVPRMSGFRGRHGFDFREKRHGNSRVVRTILLDVKTVISMVTFFYLRRFDSRRRSGRTIRLRADSADLNLPTVRRGSILISLFEVLTRDQKA